MKRVITVLLSVLMLIGVMTGCAGSGRNTDKNTTGDKLNVVTTIFPEYDWVREIAGDKADITMLLDSGVDLHSYQPTAEDIVKISTCNSDS